MSNLGDFEELIDNQALLSGILGELKKINIQLMLITDNQINDTEID